MRAESDASLQFLFERFIDLANVKGAILLRGLFILQAGGYPRQGLVNEKVVADSAFEQALQRRHSIPRPAQHLKSDPEIEPGRRLCWMRFDSFAKQRDRIFSSRIQNKRRCAPVCDENVPLLVQQRLGLRFLLTIL